MAGATSEAYMTGTGTLDNKGKKANKVLFAPIVRVAPELGDDSGEKSDPKNEYFYLKIKIRGQEDGEDIEIYANTGAERSIIIRKLLQEFEHITILKTRKVKSIGKGRVTCKE
ncbi:hypothetical protein GGR58DRAFT_499336 [Xylaria digitata]|nr:hypothetical protein GGR58DRAFT_499336 [Xylaria digitata]